MGTLKCGCVYADSRNRASVRHGTELGGYRITACDLHKPKGTTIDPPPRCQCCQTELKPGIAMQSTVTGISDFIGGECVTLSPGGPGKVIDCLKCPQCGYSVSKGNDK